MICQVHLWVTKDQQTAATWLLLVLAHCWPRYAVIWLSHYRGNTTDSHSLLGGTNLCLLNNLCPAHGECFNIKEDIGVSPVQ